MRLLLIRHGETVDNVAAVYAGVTDSALTNHGVLQASRLGAHLASTGVKVAHIFSSDLQRAVRTAAAVREAQSPIPPETTELELLREQDFGSYEGKKTIDRPRESKDKDGKETRRSTLQNKPGFKDVESKEHMRLRMETFVDSHLIQLLHDTPADRTIVVVAHGIILNYLWRVILKRFHPRHVTVSRSVQVAERGFSLEYLGGWSNTGYLDLEILPRPSTEVQPISMIPQSAIGVSDSIQPPLVATPLPVTASDATVNSSEIKTAEKILKMSLVVKAANNQEHLIGLKKTRGGLGSLKHDICQKTMDSFFKKRRTE